MADLPFRHGLGWSSSYCSPPLFRSHSLIQQTLFFLFLMPKCINTTLREPSAPAVASTTPFRGHAPPSLIQCQHLVAVRMHYTSTLLLDHASVYHAWLPTGLLMKCVSTTRAPHLWANSSDQGLGVVGLPTQNIVDPLPDMRTCSKPRACTMGKRKETAGLNY